MCSICRFLPTPRHILTLPQTTYAHQALNSLPFFMGLLSDSFYVYQVTFSRSQNPSSCLRSLMPTLNGCKNDVSLLHMRTKSAYCSEVDQEGLLGPPLSYLGKPSDYIMAKLVISFSVARNSWTAAALGVSCFIDCFLLMDRDSFI